MQFGNTDREIAITGLVNGTVTLSNGNIATIKNQVVKLYGDGKITSGQPTYNAYDVPTSTVVIDGALSTSYGSVFLSIPTSSIAPPVPPVVVPPLASPAPTVTAFTFDNQLNLGGDFDLVTVRVEAAAARKLEQAEGSPLAISRIHPGLRSQGF